MLAEALMSWATKSTPADEGSPPCPWRRVSAMASRRAFASLFEITLRETRTWKGRVQSQSESGCERLHNLDSSDVVSLLVHAPPRWLPCPISEVERPRHA